MRLPWCRSTWNWRHCWRGCFPSSEIWNAPAIGRGRREWWRWSVRRGPGSPPCSMRSVARTSAPSANSARPRPRWSSWSLDPGSPTLLGGRLQGLPAPFPLRQPEGESPLVLVDGPDHNTGRSAHRETSRLLAEEADLLVVVVHPQGIIELAQLQFLAPFLGRRRVVGVLGHADEVSAEARTELLDQLVEVLGESLGQAPLDVIRWTCGKPRSLRIRRPGAM